VGWVRYGAGIGLLCIVPLAISQTHQGAALSHGIFVFHLLGAIKFFWGIIQHWHSAQILDIPSD